MNSPIRPRRQVGGCFSHSISRRYNNLPILNRAADGLPANSYPATCHVQLQQQQQEQQEQQLLLLLGLLGPREYAEVCIPKIYSDSGFVSCTQCAIATVQVRYCVMLYAHSNTTRYTKHAGFGFNCAARSNTRDRLAGKGVNDVNGTGLPIAVPKG
jgi:hypothetical protein